MTAQDSLVQPIHLLLRNIDEVIQIWSLLVLSHPLWIKKLKPFGPCSCETKLDGGTVFSRYGRLRSVFKWSPSITGGNTVLFHAVVTKGVKRNCIRLECAYYIIESLPRTSWKTWHNVFFTTSLQQANLRNRSRSWGNIWIASLSYNRVTRYSPKFGGFTRTVLESAGYDSHVADVGAALDLYFLS